MAIDVRYFEANNKDTNKSKQLWNTDGTTGWSKEKSVRTITFMEKPTGYFATWLEANATKVTDKSSDN